MSKILKSNTLRGPRPLLAISLAASIAAFSCTTDRTLGNGRPTDSNGVRTAPTAGVTSGSETAPTPPPMMSSYSSPEGVITSRIQPLSPNDAAAIMAANRPKYRYLGEIGSTATSARPSVTSTSVAAAQASPYARVPVVGGDDADFVVAPIDQTQVDSLTTDNVTATSTGPAQPPLPITGTAASTRSATTVAPLSMTPTNSAATVRPLSTSATVPLRVITEGNGVTISNQ